MKITGTTRVCMSVANPNRGTPSPVMHNAAFGALGLDYVYVAFEPDDIAAAIGAVRGLKMAGCSISKPFKVDAMRYVDRLDSVAEEIGAINTIVNADGVLTGYNTDWTGAVEALRSVIALAGTRVAILGAGAAAQAVVFGLVKEKARPLIFNRSDAAGRTLAAQFDLEFAGGLSEVVGRSDLDVLVNCTSVGREEGDSLGIDLATLPALKAVLDVTFTRASTELLDNAEALAVTAVHGTEMLVEQGAVQFRLFTGAEPPLEEMRAALRAHLFS